MVKNKKKVVAPPRKKLKKEKVKKAKKKIKMNPKLSYTVLTMLAISVFTTISVVIFSGQINSRIELFKDKKAYLLTEKHNTHVINGYTFKTSQSFSNGIRFTFDDKGGVNLYGRTIAGGVYDGIDYSGTEFLGTRFKVSKDSEYTISYKYRINSQIELANSQSFFGLLLAKYEMSDMDLYYGSYNRDLLIEQEISGDVTEDFETVSITFIAEEDSTYTAILPLSKVTDFTLVDMDVKEFEIVKR